MFYLLMVIFIKLWIYTINFKKFDFKNNNNNCLFFFYELFYCFWYTFKEFKIYSYFLLNFKPTKKIP